MSSDPHIWRNRYRTPLPRGATIQKQRPGKKVVDCLLEIQDVVTDLKQVDQPTFRLRHRVSYPTRNTVIRIGKPGALYSEAITELQYYVDTLLDAPYKWVYRYGRPVPSGTIHKTRPGWSLAKAITELQDVIDSIEGHELLDIYNEHRQALLQSAVETATLAEIRYWLGRNCSNFVDHVNGPLNVTRDEFVYFTSETWREAANITTDDLTGYRDIEKGFNALKWTSLLGRSGKGGDTLDKEVGARTLIECQTAWENTEWEYRSGVAPCPLIAYFGNWPPPGPYPWFEARRRSSLVKPYVSTAPVELFDEIAHVALLYAYAVDPGPTIDTGVFVDTDNLGLIEDQYALIETFEKLATSTREKDFRHLTSFPFVNQENERFGYNAYFSFLFKWDFTQA